MSELDTLAAETPGIKKLSPGARKGAFLALLFGMALVGFLWWRNRGNASASTSTASDTGAVDTGATGYDSGATGGYSGSGYGGGAGYSAGSGYDPSADYASILAGISGLSTQIGSAATTTTPTLDSAGSVETGTKATKGGSHGPKPFANAVWSPRGWIHGTWLANIGYVIPGSHGTKAGVIKPKPTTTTKPAPGKKQAHTTHATAPKAGAAHGVTTSHAVKAPVAGRTAVRHAPHHNSTVRRRVAAR